MAQKKFKNNTCTKEIFNVGLKKLHPNQGMQSQMKDATNVSQLLANQTNVESNMVNHNHTEGLCLRLLKRTVLAFQKAFFASYSSKQPQKSDFILLKNQSGLSLATFSQKKLENWNSNFLEKTFAFSPKFNPMAPCSDSFIQQIRRTVWQA